MKAYYIPHADEELGRRSGAHTSTHNKCLISHLNGRRKTRRALQVRALALSAGTQLRQTSVSFAEEVVQEGSFRLPYDHVLYTIITSPCRNSTAPELSYRRVLREGHTNPCPRCSAHQLPGAHCKTVCTARLVRYNHGTDNIKYENIWLMSTLGPQIPSEKWRYASDGLPQRVACTGVGGFHKSENATLVKPTLIFTYLALVPNTFKAHLQ